MLSRTPPSDDALRVRIWGARGSMPASGPGFVGFGGHTACVEVQCGERLFVVNAGTGIVGLGAALGPEPPTIDLLFSHLHLDHVGGLPFFKPALTPGRTVRTWCGHLGGESAAAALDRLYAPPLFPVRLDQFPGCFEHVGFRAGETLRFPDGAAVATQLLNHPGGATGYRFHHRGRSVCYISDIEHSEPWPPPDLVGFVAGADLVIFDGMFTESEYPACRGWGHSTWQKGVDLCEAAEAGALAVFHHHPAHDDTALTAMEAELQAVLPSAFLARQGQVLAFAPAE